MAPYGSHASVGPDGHSSLLPLHHYHHSAGSAGHALETAANTTFVAIPLKTLVFPSASPGLLTHLLHKARRIGGGGSGGSGGGGSGAKDRTKDKTALLPESDADYAILYDASGASLTTDVPLPVRGMLGTLRRFAAAPECSADGIENMFNYYAQLIYLDQKGSTASTAARCETPATPRWTDAFRGEPQPLTGCLQYEKAAVLYNIAAVYSRMGCNQNLQSKEGLKQAAALFQKAAGMIQYIHTALVPRFSEAVESDMSESALEAQNALLLGQATQCFFERAMTDAISSAVMSMVAAQVADYYQMALIKATTGAPAKPRLPKAWMARLNAKYHVFLAMAHFHFPTVSVELAVRERIARVVCAKDHVDDALRHASEVEGALRLYVAEHAETIDKNLQRLVDDDTDAFPTARNDKGLLQPLKRPVESLVEATPFAAVHGDLMRFPNLMEPPLVAARAEADISAQDVMQLLVQLQTVETQGDIERTTSASSLQHVALEFAELAAHIESGVAHVGHLEAQLATPHLLQGAQGFLAVVDQAVQRAESCKATLEPGCDAGTAGQLDHILLRASSHVQQCRQALLELQKLYDIELLPHAVPSWTWADIAASLDMDALRTHLGWVHTGQALRTQHEGMLSEVKTAMASLRRHLSLASPADTSTPTSASPLSSRPSTLAHPAQAQAGQDYAQAQQILETALDVQQQIRDFHRRHEALVHGRQRLDAIHGALAAYFGFRSDMDQLVEGLHQLHETMEALIAVAQRSHVGLPGTPASPMGVASDLLVTQLAITLPPAVFALETQFYVSLRVHGLRKFTSPALAYPDLAVLERVFTPIALAYADTTPIVLELHAIDGPQTRCVLRADHTVLGGDTAASAPPTALALTQLDPTLADLRDRVSAVLRIHWGQAPASPSRALQHALATVLASSAAPAAPSYGIRAVRWAAARPADLGKAARYLHAAGVLLGRARSNSQPPPLPQALPPITANAPTDADLPPLEDRASATAPSAEGLQQADRDVDAVLTATGASQPSTLSTPSSPGTKERSWLARLRDRSNKPAAAAAAAVDEAAPTIQPAAVPNVVLAPMHEMAEKSTSLSRPGMAASVHEHPWPARDPGAATDPALGAAVASAYQPDARGGTEDPNEADEQAEALDAVQHLPLTATKDLCDLRGADALVTPPPRLSTLHGDPDVAETPVRPASVGIAEAGRLAPPTAPSPPVATPRRTHSQRLPRRPVALSPEHQRLTQWVAMQQQQQHTPPDPTARTAPRGMRRVVSGGHAGLAPKAGTPPPSQEPATLRRVRVASVQHQTQTHGSTAGPRGFDSVCGLSAAVAPAAHPSGADGGAWDAPGAAGGLRAHTQSSDVALTLARDPGLRGSAALQWENDVLVRTLNRAIDCEGSIPSRPR